MAVVAMEGIWLPSYRNDVSRKRQNGLMLNDLMNSSQCEKVSCQAVAQRPSSGEEKWILLTSGRLSHEVNELPLKVIPLIDLGLL